MIIIIIIKIIIIIIKIVMIRIIIKKIVLNSKKKIKGYTYKSTTNLKIKEMRITLETKLKTKRTQSSVWPRRGLN